MTKETNKETNWFVSYRLLACPRLFILSKITTTFKELLFDIFGSLAFDYRMIIKYLLLIYVLERKVASCDNILVATLCLSHSEIYF